MMIKKPRIIFTTDVNGTTTPDNTFAELVRADGLHGRMAELVKNYTTGACSFSQVFPEMEKLTRKVDRPRLAFYAKRLPLFTGVEKTLNALADPVAFNAKVALSTTGFGGLIALVNKYRHGSRLKVAASPVLLKLLDPGERKCLIHDISSEDDKIQVIDDLILQHVPEPGLIFHVGDTLGDFPALLHVAQKGGTGIAFCPNQALKDRIRRLDERIQKRIIVVEPTPQGPDYSKVLKTVCEKMHPKP